ncbi:hypothetical protein FA13DRAFT_1791313 [Coprinellus micaceus]|uniref:Uncharacterized protein n=1 Tax=Coprinellus micaceus TaxID=71717 RepID=A0A4Y7TD83_COPMI|nr:hypothetical protein FA13DRAFT_1791313 [Coprinellus micaceus]
MSSQPFYFRRRIGRAASPPTWACYEQIRYENEDYSDSDSDSCSEDDEDYVNVVSQRRSDVPTHGDSNTTLATGAVDNGRAVGDPLNRGDNDNLEMEMEMGDDAIPRAPPSQKDLKGKQRAVDPEPEPVQMGHRGRRHVKKRRQPTYTLRPILTIQRSQGFVWNQVRGHAHCLIAGSWLTRDIILKDLFVPPYIKDRYIASTSPPSSKGFLSASASSTNSALTDYEVEVVEIRIQEGELRNIIP